MADNDEQGAAEEEETPNVERKKPPQEDEPLKRAIEVLKARDVKAELK